MAGYNPLRITGMQGGLVQSREEFLLPDDAYPVLQNAYVWRERILRKRGFELLGRLQRNLNRVSIGTITSGGAGTVTVNLFAALGLSATEPNASIALGSAQTILIIIAAPISQTLRDTTGTGVLTVIGAGPITSATINYSTGIVSIVFSGAGGVSAASFTGGYYPGLPVMGIRLRDLTDASNDQTIFFDQKYAYIFNSVTNQFEEFLPLTNTTWNASNTPITGVDFFWSTNFWMSDITNFTTVGQKLFWVTNNTGSDLLTADPIRITDGTTWLDFVPSAGYGQIDATTFVWQTLAMLPFRGRIVFFNTWEGPSFGVGQNFSNRIRWAEIGNPFIPFSAGPPATGAWRSDIRGKGGFLDIPTSEDIISVGFVRDNLVIYCERSTWQLRYTGRSISPFQIEKVNSELGAEGTFSSVQFDTSLLGIGDKGIIECDSYKSERIDIKIPDLVFQFNSANNGVKRVHGIRDFVNRLAYWTIPLAAINEGVTAPVFPNQRLVYNYENDSWALFDDSLTTLGTFQPQSSRTWLNTPIAWVNCNFSWIDEPAQDPIIVGGNQQGFIENLDQLVVNDISLFISAITSDGNNPTVITSPSHNLLTGMVISISGIVSGGDYTSLNGGIFGIVVQTTNTFELFTYDSATGQFSTPQTNPSGTYLGGGLITIRENFSIISKKFNFLDEGQNIQLGYIDVLMQATQAQNPGAISLNVYLDYNDNQTSNTLPKNQTVYFPSPSSTIYPLISADTFFNATIPTTQSSLSNIGGSKFWQRVYCPTRASFLTLQYTLSNAQLAGQEQVSEVQIDAQILWIRKAGRMTSI